MHSSVQFPPVPIRGAPLRPLSVAAYHALGEAGLIPKNTELLYGFVYRKTSKSPLHSTLVRKLVAMMQDTVPPGFLLSSEQPIECADSEPEPDVSLVRASVADYSQQHPKTAELVVEVCVTSHDYDHSKLQAYASAGIRECWFVLGPEKQIEVYRSLENGAYAEHAFYGPGGILTCASVPEIIVSLENLFA